MKRSHKAAGVLAALGLALAAAVQAHPGGRQDGMGLHGKGGMQQLMTPEERSAAMEKIRNAKTPEERQKIAEANRAEMQKRAKEKGITLPEHRGPRAGATSGADTHTH